MPKTTDLREWPSYAQGSTPDALYREERRGNRTFTVINDPRAAFAAGIAEQLGANYSRETREIIFENTPANAKYIEAALENIGQIPYYEVNRDAVPYAREKLYEERVGVLMYRPRYPDNERNRSSISLCIAPSEESWKRGEAIAREACTAYVADHLEEIKAAIANGKISDSTLRPIDEKLSVAAILDGTAEVTPHAASRIVNEIRPASTKTIESLRTLIKDGRLNAANAKQAIDEASLLKLTQADAYRLQSYGNSLATSRQRATVVALTEMDILSPRNVGDPNLLKVKDASRLIAEGLRYVTSDQQEQFDRLQSSSLGRTSAGGLAKDQNGYFIDPKTREERRHNSGRAMAEFIDANLPKAQQVDLRRSEALVLAAATPHHLLATTADRSQYALIERGGRFAFRQTLDESISNLGEWDPTPPQPGHGRAPEVVRTDGTIVTLEKSGDRIFVDVSKQPTLEAAECELRARTNLGARMGKTAVVLASDVEQFKGQVYGVYSDYRALYNEQDQQLLVVPNADLDRPSAGFMQVATFTQAQPAGARVATRARSATRSRAAVD
ncbi:MAG: hypothetical protein WAJ85_10890 [Candidatus Baltobacteraceae bacterium]